MADRKAMTTYGRVKMDKEGCSAGTVTGSGGDDGEKVQHVHVSGLSCVPCRLLFGVFTLTQLYPGFTLDSK